MERIHLGLSFCILLTCVLLALWQRRGSSEDEYVRRGMLKDSKFVMECRNESYLLGLLGHATVRVEEYDSTCDGDIEMNHFNRSQVLVNFNDFVDRLSGETEECLSHTARRVQYLADCDVAGRAAVWLEDGGCMYADDAALLLDMPTTLPNVGFLTDGQPPGAISLFIGNGSVSQYHYDEDAHVVVLQVHGKKRFILAPPTSTPEIQYFKPYPMCKFGNAGSSRAPDRWRKRALSVANSMEYVLEPGDLLFIPAFVWHAVYAERIAPGPPGVSMTFFFSNANTFPLEPHNLQIECVTGENL
eukprot:TRINITY_DN15534_c4_g1_i1.p1 TRINITY_DN15534_c4_g1~~TRINITY_DN15534_c4_g1_i1.p1  ORF type:complete len:301 (+),score=51.61 TRINITY_DN15534_c4_g1_i1:1-903(+)